MDFEHITAAPERSGQMPGSAWYRGRKIGFLFWILTGGAGLGLSFVCFVDYENGWVPLLIAIPMSVIGMFNNWPSKVCEKRSLLFSRRKQIAAEAEQWCKDHNCPASPLNIVTAISSLKLMDEPNSDYTTPVRISKYT